MSSGQKTMVINTQERAVSVDINRLQAFDRNATSEMFRYLMNVTSTDDIDAGANDAEHTTVESPLRAEILNGLQVTPQVGSLALSISQGTMMALSPDAAADDSNYKFVEDPGISTGAGLAMTSNASGSIRIDVIEVQVGYVVSETDNRDIFNPSTGLFSASTVNKAQQAVCTTPVGTNSRVRLGTPGSGFPGFASGWLPLCVASVPTGTTTNDTITFWDVRPLVNDRQFNMSGLTSDYPLVNRVDYSADDVTSSGKILMNGSILTFINGYRAGGTIRRGTPGSDANQSVDLADSANWASGFALAASSFYYVYLMFPGFGGVHVPRWARYNDAPAARIPRSPRGILVVSNVAPRHRTGKPSAAIGMPTSTGLLITTTDGICVGVGYTNSSTVQLGMLADGQDVWIHNASSTKPFTVANDGLGITVAGSGVSSSGATFTLIEGTTHPANARAIYACVQTSGNTASTEHVASMLGPTGGPAAPFLRVSPPGQTQANANIPLPMISNAGVGTSVIFNTGLVKIPLPNQYNNAAGSNIPLTLECLLFDITGNTALTSPGASLLIYGYELSN